MGYGQDDRRLRGPAEEGRGGYGVSIPESCPKYLSFTIYRKEWFAVTALPLFAGTFGTIASALNICALVGPWRCEVDPGSYDIIHYIHDPSWCVFTSLNRPYSNTALQVDWHQCQLHLLRSDSESRHTTSLGQWIEFPGQIRP